MAHVTYPRIFFDEEAGMWRAEMVDKKTGRTWGHGYGETRNEAVGAARKDLPSEQRIKKAIGWINRHPFIAGAAIGAYISFRKAQRHPGEARVIDFLVPTVALGTLAWGLSKLYGSFQRRSYSLPLDVKFSREEV